MTNLVPFFEKTDVEWKYYSSPQLLSFLFHTRLYIQNFNFASADGLDNFKSNLHTIAKEVAAELRTRGIKAEH